MAGGWSPEAADEITLPSGLKVAYSYHFNRNAIKTYRRAGSSVVALTRSGNLLRFELPSWKLTNECVGYPEAVCLGEGTGGNLLAGLADGRILEVNPGDLERAKVAQVPDRPAWVGAYRRDDAKGILAITEDPRWRSAETSREMMKAGEKPVWTLLDLGRKKTHPLPPRVDIGLVDSKLRLWLGKDGGEFGGWCGYVDLPREQLHVVSKGPNTDGFVELPDGQIWSYASGGHMNFMWSAIRRVDTGKPDRLYNAEQDAMTVAGHREFERRKIREPLGYLSGILCEPGGQTVLVKAEGGLFRSDLTLKKWELVKEPPEFAKGRLGGVPELPGQLGAGEITCLLPASEGMLYLEGWWREGCPWRRIEGKWQRMALPLPREEEGRYSGWGTHVLAGKDGQIVSVNVGNPADGVGTIVWLTSWKEGKVSRFLTTRAERWVHPKRVFATPDGVFWHVAWNQGTGKHSLMRLAGKVWEEAAAAPGELTGVRVVNGDGPPWLLNAALVLSYGPDERPGGANVKLSEPRLGAPSGARPEVYDATPWSPGTVLLATSAGLRLYDVKKDAVVSLRLVRPSGKVERLCRDGLGRVWMAGDRFRVTDPEGERLRSLDSLPVVGPGVIQALAADPEHKDGVIAALGTRGVLFLRAQEPKAP